MHQPGLADTSNQKAGKSQGPNWDVSCYASKISPVLAPGGVHQAQILAAGWLMTGLARRPVTWCWHRDLSLQKVRGLVESQDDARSASASQLQPGERAAKYCPGGQS